MTEVATTVPPAPVKPGIPVKLTTEEMNTRYQFIGRCVDRNINYPGQLRFGVNTAMSVQELCAANIDTLRNIAKSIKKVTEGHDPEIDGTEEIIISRTPAAQWLQFVLLTIRKKNWDKYAADNKAHIKNLKEKIAAAKTPEELRKEAELELAGLKGFDDED